MSASGYTPSRRKIVLIGYGNVGTEVEKVLLENGHQVDGIVRSSGAQEPDLFDEHTIAFISVPSRGNGDEMLHYYTNALERGARIVTCEKAVLANHWQLVTDHPGRIKYSATVGGNSGMLPAISDFEGNIEEIWAVVNGTLNYLSSALAQGQNEETIYAEVTSRGYAEPGAHSIQEVIRNELQDVAYKAAILANHSNLLSNAVKATEIELHEPEEGTGCAVHVRSGKLEAGFLPKTDRHLFPDGVNNVLYINGGKVAEGPGAGARATALRMLMDFLEFEA
ncbi:MAG TPA: hypothetical protein VFY28_01775 [Candidatus Paceibacterota bacterium]|nr:hypothetical protein [Candidatus Paceibacterota bacterium]